MQKQNHTIHSIIPFPDNQSIIKFILNTKPEDPYWYGHDVCLCFLLVDKVITSEKTIDSEFIQE